MATTWTQDAGEENYPVLDLPGNGVLVRPVFPEYRGDPIPPGQKDGAGETVAWTQPVDIGHAKLDITAGLIPWFHWGPRESGNQLFNSTELYFHTEVTCGPHDEGIIIAGGGQESWVLYLYDGILTLSKRVNPADSAAGVLDLNYDVDSNQTIDIEAHLVADPGYMQLVVNGEEVGTQTWSNLTTLAGTGSLGGTGVVWGGVVPNRAGYITGQQGDFTGTIYGADFYDGKTPLFSWVPMQAQFKLANAGTLRFRVVVDLNTTDSGAIVEYGGAGVGMLLYPHIGTLYFQAGAGNNFGQSANNNRAEVSYSIPTSGRYIIEVYGASSSNEVVLYINGTEVDSAAFSAGALCGIDGGAAGRCENAVCVNRAGMSAGSGCAFTGHIIGNAYFFEFTYPTGGNRLITNRFPLAAYLAGDKYDPFANAVNISMRVIMAPSDSGILYEVGNASAATVIYIHQGIIYARAGTASNYVEEWYPLNTGGSTGYNIELMIGQDFNMRFVVGGAELVQGIPTGTDIFLPTTTKARFGEPQGGTVPLPIMPSPFTGTINYAATWSDEGFVAQYVQDDDLPAYDSSLRHFEASVLAEFDNADTGFLFEIGGGSHGIMCYLHGGKLYLQVGENDATGTDPNGWRFELQHTITDTTPRMHCVRVIVDKDWNSGDGYVQLWLNDDFVSAKDFNASFQFAQSTYTGGVGKIGVQTQVNHGGWTNASAGTFTGSIDGMWVTRAD